VADRGVRFFATLALFAIMSRHAGATCGYTTFTPPGQGSHVAIYLTDPSGQQTATFDLVWGGMLASLKYNGIEHVVGNHTVTMVQPNWFYYPSANPYQIAGAGDINLQGAPVPSVYCSASNQLLIITGLVDFAAGSGGYTPLPAARQTLLEYGPGVGDDRNLGDMVSGMYAAPYTLTTAARFVPNPSAPPAYYLRLDYKITNNHPTEQLPFGHWFRASTPYDHTTTALAPSNCASSSSCQSSTTPYLITGRYVDAGRTNGIAFYLSPQTAWSSGTTAWAVFGTDVGLQTQQVSLVNQFWAIAPRTSRQWALYALVGEWSRALTFAQAGGPAPPDAPTVLQATATGTTAVQITWSSSLGATSYQLERSSGGGGYVPVAYPASPPYTDAGLQPATTYLYQARAQGPGGLSDPSSRDLATTILFTDDDPQHPYSLLGKTVKAAHITELRQAVNAVRTAAGLTISSWTDPTIYTGANGTLIRKVHIDELRSSLIQARTQLGLFVSEFIDDPITAGVSVIRKEHIGQLRQGVK